MDRSKGRGPEVVKLDTATGRLSGFARGAMQAAYSPDGSRIALISYRDRVVAQTEDGPRAIGELYVVGANGSGWRRLTNNREKQEESPAWDPSGQRLAFTSDSGPEWLRMGLTNVVMEINADGSCPTNVFGVPREEKALGPGLYGPTWQPGPGREAGPIAC